MKTALRFATIRGIRTTMQALAGVAASVPAIASLRDARTAGVVAAFGVLGAVIAGLAAFFQNLGERLESLEGHSP